MPYESFVYHGTNKDNVGSITANNFRDSTNRDDWLGRGVYFFVDGISDPVGNATEWACCQAYKQGCYQYDEYAVIKAKVSADKVLDVTSIEGLKAYNKVRNGVIRTHSKYYAKDRNRRHDDCFMWDSVAKLMGIDLVINHLYIQNMTQRKLKISSNTPNTTVMCVKKQDVIDKVSIHVVSTGRTRR